MKMRLLTTLCISLVFGTTCLAKPDAAAEASKLELQGQFKQAAEVLSTALKDKSLPGAEQQKLAFELDRLDRIKQDFTLTKGDLFNALKDSLKGLTAAEFDQWIKEGRFDYRDIDGTRYFMNDSVRNLYMRYPALEVRRLHPRNSAALDKARLESIRSIKAAALAEKVPYVLPKRFDVTMTVTAHANAAPAGEILRAWIPFPREYPFQTDINLVSTSKFLKNVDDPQSPIRSVYMEQPAQAGKPTQFAIEYQYTARGVWFDINPDMVRPLSQREAALRQFTQEAPHVVFTPELRKLSQQIVGNETNPYWKAKKCYDWISEHILYSFAIEYSTIRNISDYCRSKGYGDCGQEALLFIALCRLNDVPARWQTGWNLFSGDKSNHDWSEIYLPPYGWMPVDPYMGVWVMHYATTLTPEQKRELRDFYFGGLDQYRMIANSDHSQALRPPKHTMRSDDVDFQRGEVEYDDHNLYFDKFSYSLTMKEVPLPAAKP
ncbi:MAG TPA: transglutaminase-like domain-containing protein [Candidatus Acidoferrum sp.]|nr:transglutaminase-like domain-containing protein [Candidatus Acidoferrum sp.]